MLSFIPTPKSIFPLKFPNNGLLLLHYNMLISIMIDSTRLLFFSVTDQSQELCTQWGHNDRLMQHPPPPNLPLHLLPFLPNFHFSLPFFLPVFSIPCLGSFHKASIEAREKDLEAAAGHSFLQGRYRAAGSSLHERAPFLQLLSVLLLPSLFTKALLCHEQGSTEKKKG